MVLALERSLARWILVGFVVAACGVSRRTPGDAAVAGSSGSPDETAGDDSRGGGAGLSSNGARGGSTSPAAGSAQDGGTSGGSPAGAGGGSPSGGQLGLAGQGGATAGAGGETPCMCTDGGEPCCDDACPTEGVDCDELRASFTVPETSLPPSAEEEACREKLRAAILERCAFELPECSDPTASNAPFSSDGVSECNEDETREALRCGNVGSSYAPDCCRRSACLSDAECPAGDRCLLDAVQWHTPYGLFGGTDGCYLRTEGCLCRELEIGRIPTGYCIGAEEELARFDCDASTRTCDELAGWQEHLLQSIAYAESERGPEFAAAVIPEYWRCQSKVMDEREARCEPVLDCTSLGCDVGECLPCTDPEGDPHFVCLYPNGSCTTVSGAGGQGGADGSG